MPSFETMQKKYKSQHIGAQIKDFSNMVFDQTFSNNTTYRKGKIYNCNMKEIYDPNDVDKKPIELEFKFIKTKTYTIDKDQVEYWVQFKTGVNPEFDYYNLLFNYLKTEYLDDQRLGFYIDILDDNTNRINKWLIIGKDEGEFDRYNVLKCNYEFEWIDKERNYHKILGCLRNQNSYNSGVWSDGFIQTVDDQMKFIIPTNQETKTIDYDIRFMITDNDKYPKTYEITKILDTFPLGTTICTLKQDHYNSSTDICRIISIDETEFTPINDGKLHKICDYNKSNLKPNNSNKDQNEDIIEEDLIWKLSKTPNQLYVKGQPINIKAIPNIEGANINYKWQLYIDDKKYINDFDDNYINLNVDNKDTFMDNYYYYKNNNISNYYLQDYFNINVNDETNTFTITAINKNMINYILKIEIYNEDKIYDSVEMEVTV